MRLRWITKEALIHFLFIPPSPSLTIAKKDGGSGRYFFAFIPFDTPSRAWIIMKNKDKGGNFWWWNEFSSPSIPEQSLPKRGMNSSQKYSYITKINFYPFRNFHHLHSLFCRGELWRLLPGLHVHVQRLWGRHPRTGLDRRPEKCRRSLRTERGKYEQIFTHMI